MDAVSKYLCDFPHGMSPEQKKRIAYFADKTLNEKCKEACNEITKRFGWSLPDRIEKLSEEVGELDIEVKRLAAKAEKLRMLDKECIKTKDTPEYKEASEAYEKQLAMMLKELADCWIVITHIVSMIAKFFGNKTLHKMLTYVYAKWTIRDTMPNWGHTK